MERGFRSHEQQLRALAESSLYEITKADQLSESLLDLAALMSRFSEKDVLEGRAADAARAAFGRLSVQFTASAEWVDRVRALIDEANAQLFAARSALWELPSLEVDNSAWNQTLDAFKEVYGGETSHEIAQDNREAAAREQLNRIDTRLHEVAESLTTVATAAPQMHGRDEIPDLDSDSTDSSGEPPTGPGSRDSQTSNSQTYDSGTASSNPAQSAQSGLGPAASWLTDTTDDEPTTGSGSHTGLSADSDLTGASGSGSWGSGSSGLRSSGSTDAWGGSASSTSSGLGAGLASGSALAAGSRWASGGGAGSGQGAGAQPAPVRTYSTRGLGLAAGLPEMRAQAAGSTSGQAGTPGGTPGGTAAMMGGGGGAGAGSSEPRRRAYRGLYAPIIEEEEEPKPLPPSAGPGNRVDGNLWDQPRQRPGRA